MSSKGVALVTGAGQGIGKGVALRLASDGFDVAVNDIPANTEKVAAVVEEIKAKGRSSSAHIADVSIEEQVKKMVADVVEAHGGLDVMVANAGIMNYAPIPRTTVEDWDRVMSINARGTFLCFKYAGIQMISQGRGGRIIGASSLGGKKGGALTSAYCASKFAIRGLTQAAALEFGQHRITVNSYAPGTTDTEMLQGMDKSHAELTGSTPGTFVNLLKKIMPTPDIATPDDIAGLVSYIASKESQFVTGQTISINGGMYFD